MKRGILLVVSVLILAGCATRKPVVKQKLPETKLPAYESIGFYINAGDPAKALEAYKKAYSTNPESTKTKNLYSSLLLTAGKMKEAESVIQDTLRQAPKDPDALYNLAMLESLQNHPQKEKSALEKIIAQNPHDARALSSLGELYLTEKNYKQAERSFDESLQIDGNNLVARSGYGNLLLREKKYGKAVIQFNKLIEKNPHYSYAYADRSKAKAGLNDAEGALKDLDKAVELAPSYWNYIDRGKLLAFLGKRDKALKDFSRAIEINPRYFYAYVYRAGLFKDKGENSKALSDYEMVYKERPDYYFVYEPLAVLEYMANHYTKAAELFRKAMERWPEEPSYFLMTGISLEASGKKKEAVKFFKDKLNHLSSKSYFYDVARMFIEPGFDAYLIAKLDHEKKLPLKTRVLFYAATYYKLQGDTSLAQKYFLEVADARIYGIFETDIAENEVKEIEAQ